ncbi:MAG: hypothetical protein KDA27_26325 [Candidatus Eisenbacteria bacterium]|uniref:Tetratricopeptide repeat protein n=1 Tax=Eiseniibacteriota bacterium TaxID=2212470 RepID=A0A956SG09_UNCEI|nr:hypothetical protein [Candidatus Eisenbacteria bacterium]
MDRILAVSVFLLLLGGLVGPATAFDPEIRRAYQTDPRACVELCETYLETPGLSDSSRIDVLLFQARAYHLLGERDRVVETLRKVATIDPDYELDGPAHGSIWREYLEVFGPALKHRPGISTVAVFDFKNCVTGDDREEWEGAAVVFARKLQGTLESSTTLDLVERERIDHVLQEFQLADLQDEATRVRAGEMLGAQSMVFTEVAKLDKDIVIVARVVETETSKILGTEEVVFRGSSSNGLPEIEKLGRALAEVLRAKVDEASLGANQYDAWVEYGRAMDSLRSGSEAQAFRHVSAALEQDPKFSQARTLFENLEGSAWMAEGVTPR